VKHKFGKFITQQMC